MQEIEIHIQKLLTDVAFGKAELGTEILDAAKGHFGTALERQFTKDPNKFTLRMSNIGRPSCQLWHEKNGTPKEASEWFLPLKMINGDAIEAIVIAIMRQAGIPIVATDETVSLDIDGDKLVGHTDLRIQGSLMSDGIWAVKGVSGWAFKNKWSHGFEVMAADDAFGYVAQGYLYGRASGYPFRGWVVVNKETGEIIAVPAPQSKEAEDKAIAAATETYRYLRDNRPFIRRFDDVPEVYYKTETGNKVLHNTCAWCDFKQSCWPTLQLLPHIPSKSRNPDLKYYTYVHKESDNEV